MDRHIPPSNIEGGDWYHHVDGTTEVVCAVNDGTVLTFREYPGKLAFARAIEAAAYRGIYLGDVRLRDDPISESSDL